MTSGTVQTDWVALHGRGFAGVRVLVTGGAGFIGSHLVEALAALGAAVVVLDDLSGGFVHNLAHITPVEKIEIVEGSILDRDTLARCVNGCRYVFHLAALGSVPRSVEEPRLYHDVNTTGTLNVLQAAVDAAVTRVMFAASSSVYGENPVPWVESMPTLPQSPYAATKLAGEALLCAFAASYRGAGGPDAVSLRYFNIFGPRQNANSAYAAVIAAFATAALARRPMVIYGDGEQSRDFTFVRNAVHANLLAARAERRLNGEAINVGTGGRTSVNDLARQIARILSGNDAAAPDHRAARAGDLKHSYADLRRAGDLLGYRPVVDFDSGLKETLAWYRSTSS